MTPPTDQDAPAYARLTRQQRLRRYEVHPVCPVNDENALQMQRVRWLRAEAAARPFRRFLDIACADGFVSRWLVDEPEFLHLVGVDAGRPAIIAARQAVNAFRHPGKANFHCTDYRLLRADAPFDGVWCSEFIEHLPLEEAAELLRFMQSNLAHGGRAYLCTPNRSGRWGANNPDPQHICLYDRDALLDLLRDTLGVQPVFNGYHEGCDFLMVRWSSDTSVGAPTPPEFTPAAT